MGRKCTVIAHVRNSEGKVVESKLFKSLLHYLPTRSLAKEYYKVGTDKEFLERVRDKAKFDENGEITFSSLKTLTNMDIAEESLIAKLDKELGAGTYSYQEALAKLKTFNETNELSDDYMATIEHNNGNYNLHVVRRTPNNVEKLQTALEKSELRNNLISLLRSKGVAVKFLEEGDRANSRYSTENAEKTADGLYELIQIANGADPSQLAEEAGHFAIGAMGSSPLVERLMNLLDAKTQKEVLGEEYDNKVLGANPRREVAGMLVGQALERKLSNSTPWGRLANRIATTAKSIFARFKGDEAKLAHIKAQKVASEIASKLISLDSGVNVENALSYKETMYSAMLPYNIKTFKKVVGDISTMARELEAVAADKFSESLAAITGAVVSDREDVVKSPTAVNELLAFEGLCQALVEISDLFGPDKEVDNLLDSVDLTNEADYYNHMAEYSRNLQQVRVYVRNACNIIKTLREALTSEHPDRRIILPSGETITNASYLDSITGSRERINFLAQLNRFEDLVKATESKLQAKSKVHFARFCEDIYGSKYLDISSAVVWKRGKLKAREGKPKDILDLIERLDEDIDYWHWYMGSPDNNPDIIGQIAAKAVHAANRRADRMASQIQERLLILEKRLKDEFGIKDTSIFFERDSEGRLTGNLITAPNPEIMDEHDRPLAVNYGEWEKAREEMREEAWEDFKKLHPDWETWPGFTRGILWEEYYEPIRKAWNEENSLIIEQLDEFGNKIGIKVLPNSKYKSDQFSNLIAKHPGIEKILAEYHAIKDQLDSYMPDGATRGHRAPQFKTKFAGRWRNKAKETNGIKATGYAMRRSTMEMFAQSSDDTNYGSELNMNKVNEELLGTPEDHEAEKIHRLPMFGINKLDDMNELSTDLTFSLTAYASMATSYGALRSIADSLNVGEDVLKRRLIKDDKLEEERKYHSRAYKRYTSFLEQHVYRISGNRWGLHFGNTKILWDKVNTALSRLSAFLYIAGNPLGGTVNTGTGAIEIFKAAASSTRYNLKDWEWAHEIYWKYVPLNVAQWGKLRKEDKMSLYLDYFDSGGGAAGRRRRFRNKRSRGLNFVESALYLPYSSGDHYMQAIPFLMIAKHTKLYSPAGGSTTLWEAYSVTVNEDEDKHKNGSKLKYNGHLYTSATGIEGITYAGLNEGVYLKDPNDADAYKTESEMLRRVEQGLASGSMPHFMGDELTFIRGKHLEHASLEEIQTALQNSIYSKIWTEADEIEYTATAQNESNLMHGMYNDSSATTFQKYWWGRAYLTLKRYILGTIERRFGTNRESIALGASGVEGSLNTTLKVLIAPWVKGIDFNWKDGLYATLLPHSQRAKEAMRRAGFSEEQICNTQRSLMDYIFVTIFHLLSKLTALPPEDEEEKKRREEFKKLQEEKPWLNNPYGEEPSMLMGMLHYLTSRWYIEQGMLNSPWVAASESTTFRDILPTGYTAVGDIINVGYLAAGSILADESNSEFYRQQDKKDKWDKYDAKWRYEFIKLVPYWKSWYNMTHPYEALESHLFGKKISLR